MCVLGGVVRGRLNVFNMLKEGTVRQTHQSEREFWDVLTVAAQLSCSFTPESISRLHLSRASFPVMSRHQQRFEDPLLQENRRKLCFSPPLTFSSSSLLVSPTSDPSPWSPGSRFPVHPPGYTATCELWLTSEDGAADPAR